MRNRFATIAVLLAALTGCQASKSPTQKQQANLEWNTARATVLYGLAQDQYKAHDFEKCAQTLATAMKMTPDAAGLHTLLAKVEIEQAKLELAEKELESARKMNPKDPEAYYLSGVIYQRWQRTETALDYYRQAGEHAPAELQYLLAQSEMLVALGRVPEALQLLQGKVAYFENSGAIRDAVGQLLLQQGRYAEAVGMFRQASILSEDDDAIRERLARAYFDALQYRQCAQELTRLTDAGADAKRGDLFALLGECQFHLGDSHGARLSFDKATELNPYSSRYWQSLGRATLEGGDLRGAQVALQRSIGVDPSVSETWLLLGYVRLREGAMPDALDAFERASSLDAHDTVSLCMVGYAYEKLGRHDSARQCYARAMAVKPGDDMARQLMAEIDK